MSFRRPNFNSGIGNEFFYSVVANQPKQAPGREYVWGMETDINGGVISEVWTTSLAPILVPITFDREFVLAHYTLNVTVAAGTVTCVLYRVEPGLESGRFTVRRVSGTQTGSHTATLGLNTIPIQSDFRVDPGAYYVAINCSDATAEFSSKLKQTSRALRAAATSSVGFYPITYDDLSLDGSCPQVVVGCLTKQGVGGLSAGDVTSTLVTPTTHQTLLQLIHFIDEGPAGGFTTGATKTVTGTLFPTLIEWKRSDATLLVDKTITRAGGGATNLAPTPIVWRMYDTDGVTVLETVSDAITYSGAYEASRVRTIS